MAIAGLNVQSVISPEWSNAENTAFNCIAKFAEYQETVPFTATPDDPYTHSQEIWTQGLAGAYGEINPYPGPPAGLFVAEPEMAQASAETEALKATVAALEARLAKLEGAKPTAVPATTSRKKKP